MLLSAILLLVFSCTCSPFLYCNSIEKYSTIILDNIWKGCVNRKTVTKNCIIKTWPDGRVEYVESSQLRRYISSITSNIKHPMLKEYAKEIKTIFAFSSDDEMCNIVNSMTQNQDTRDIAEDILKGYGKTLNSICHIPKKRHASIISFNKKIFSECINGRLVKKGCLVHTDNRKQTLGCVSGKIAEQFHRQAQRGYLCDSLYKQMSSSKYTKYNVYKYATDCIPNRLDRKHSKKTYRGSGKDRRKMLTPQKPSAGAIKPPKPFNFEFGIGVGAFNFNLKLGNNWPQHKSNSKHRARKDEAFDEPSSAASPDESFEKKPDESFEEQSEESFTRGRDEPFDKSFEEQPDESFEVQPDESFEVQPAESEEQGSVEVEPETKEELPGFTDQTPPALDTPEEMPPESDEQSLELYPRKEVPPQSLERLPGIEPWFIEPGVLPESQEHPSKFDFPEDVPQGSHEISPDIEPGALPESQEPSSEVDPSEEVLPGSHESFPDIEPWFIEPGELLDPQEEVPPGPHESFADIEPWFIEPDVLPESREQYQSEEVPSEFGGGFSEPEEVPSEQFEDDSYTLINELFEDRFDLEDDFDGDEEYYQRRRKRSTSEDFNSTNNAYSKISENVDLFNSSSHLIQKKVRKDIVRKWLLIFLLSAERNQLMKKLNGSNNDAQLNNSHENSSVNTSKKIEPHTVGNDTSNNVENKHAKINAHPLMNHTMMEPLEVVHNTEGLNTSTRNSTFTKGSNCEQSPIH